MGAVGPCQDCCWSPRSTQTGRTFRAGPRWLSLRPAAMWRFFDCSWRPESTQTRKMFLEGPCGTRWHGDLASIGLHASNSTHLSLFYCLSARCVVFCLFVTSLSLSLCSLFTLNSTRRFFTGQDRDFDLSARVLCILRRTPLLWASTHGHAEVVCLLLEARADKDKAGGTWKGQVRSI